ncbi:hypothetical protein SDA16_15255 [Legionella pneumophila serogroup 1]|uniref:hypothetical protein n=1 Tax=Legionella pneumophila TaxID=446 RepID=UPI0007770149|nr:hypothetical protein [Legionella pneumophila]HCC3237272.1 hypothetical protein [Legionella pneumophila subsp. pneumophila]HAT8251379.1 hypothetical protein [Legionella pneumophila]HAT8257626.1 hypothetical protein [Legionella pneumophila]HAT8260872.1 hypothetical protein [Legionella pneumophila]HAT8270201.1 hypothetical protein [Legionella pneumophila]
MFFTKTSLKNDDLNTSKLAIFLTGLASLLIIGNYDDEDTYEDVSPSFLSRMMEDTPNYPFTFDDEGFEVNIGIPFQL